ncbi:hypothetical protein M8J75_016622 [Diaphorina citri]|nr:hypothetical protein M8J75_016622 [Diaphorina citri]KAI5697868.1 hypothetical protein M8J75_016622 [Diaphorina citri]
MAQMSVDMDEDDDTPKVFETREYQTLLLEEAKTSNVILYLPTGPFSQGGKRSFFLCTTQALLYQQGKVLQKNLPYSVAFFSGADAVDYWTDETWSKILDKYQVIAFTAQILLNLLSANRIQFRQISVLIFDECHHVEAGHCMKQITDLYANQYRAGLCTTRLMGLTATLLNSDVKGKMLRKSDLFAQVDALERAFCGRVISSDTDEVLRSSTNPTEEFQIYPETEPHAIIQRLLAEVEPYFDMFKPDVMASLLNAIQPQEGSMPKRMEGGDIAFPIIKKPSVMKDLKQMYDEVQFQFKVHGLNAGNVTALIMMLAALRGNLAADLGLVANLMETFTVVRHKAEQILSQYPKSERYLQYNSPKINRLLQLLRRYNPDQRTIIFCQRRATVKMLYHLLKKVAQHSPGYESIKPDFMVGVSTHLVQNTKLAEFTKKQDKLTMLSFNRGITNILVATDVLEEGIDIQSCNLVIKFDPPQHTRSYVQSKGRARSQGSQYILMVKDSEQSKYLAQYEGFKKIEEALKEISKAKRLQLYENDYKHRRLPDDNKVNIFYVDGLESASVSESMAPSLLYYYCNTLKYDQYSNIAPSIFKLKKEDRIQNAAFQAVQRLHQIGELTDELRPVDRYEDPTNDKEWFPNYAELDNIEDPSKLVGTSRRRELYAITSPTCLSGSPVGGTQEPCYLHVITLAPQFHTSLVDTDRKKVYTQHMANGQTYALLTRRTISRLSDFPLYETLGEVKVSVAVNTALFLSKAEISKLQRFQTYLFRQVLPDCVKSFMVPTGSSTEYNAFLVVPVQPQPGATDYQINWPLVQRVQNLPVVTEEEPSVDSRKNLQLNPDNYLHNVVIPWYRHNGQRQPYLVTHISPLTSSSRFPDHDLSYSGYYQEKYNTTLYNPNQFMLCVKPVTSNLNFLCPRSTKDKRKRKDAEDSDFQEILIPELCNLVSYPIAYWIGAIYLPAVLYRVHSLLTADQLRVRIAVMSGIVPVENLRHDDAFAPLRKSAEAHLAGKKRTYTPLDLKSKARSDTLEKLRANQRVDALALDLRDLKLDAANDGTDALDEDLYRKLTAWNLEKDLDEVSIFDVVLNERKMNKVNIPLFTKSSQAGEIMKKVEYKPYEMTFEPCPHINILEIEYDSKTCKGPSQRDIYEAVSAHSANDIVNYERLETLGDSLLKLATTLCVYTSLDTLDEGALTLIKGTVVGNRNLYLAGRRLALPGYIKIHQFSPLHDWTPPCFGIPANVKQIFNEADLPPALLLDIDLSNEQLVNGELSPTTELKIMEFLSNLDFDLYQDPTEDGKKVSSPEKLPSSSYNFLDRIKLGDKVVADVVESLTGVYLRSCGIEGAMLFLQALNILPKSKIDVHEALYGPHPSAVRCPEQARGLDPLRYIPECTQLEKRINYTFQDKSFLLQALSHPTYNANRITTSYQRLEFLGDAIIDFLVTAYLYENFSHLSPGEISDIRSAMVNNVTFASYAVRLDLHKHLLHDSPRLYENVTRFAQNQEARNHEISDEVRNHY